MASQTFVEAVESRADGDDVLLPGGTDVHADDVPGARRDCNGGRLVNCCNLPSASLEALSAAGIVLVGCDDGRLVPDLHWLLGQEPAGLVDHSCSQSWGED